MNIEKKPDEYSWIRYIKYRISKNKNFLGFISGGTGSGKSYSSLSIGEMLDKNFNIDRIVFNGLELMQLINSGTLKKGSVIVFEEAGIEMNAKNWQSTTNKMLNFLIQTFRHKNFILIFNSPYMDFVDASTRRLFHAELTTQGIDFKACKVKIKPQLLQYNSRTRKTYYKRLKVRANGRVVALSSWDIPKPSQALLEVYEKKKSEFTNRLNKEIMEKLEGVQDTTKKPLTAIQQEIFDLLQQKHDVNSICDITGKANQTIYKSIELIKKKGYTITPVKIGSKVEYFEISDNSSPRFPYKETGTHALS